MNVAGSDALHSPLNVILQCLTQCTRHNLNLCHMASIGVVIVTYNRVQLLQEALECFRAQTYPPAYIIVVNNASTDGTAAFLKEWAGEKGTPYARHVLSLPSNTGGSGGFHAGLANAMQKEADWIWVSDDDAFPRSDALEQMNRFLESRSGEWDDISAICGAVYCCGEIDCTHRKRIARRGLKVEFSISEAEEYEQDCFEINGLSYVGSVISRRKLVQVGLTREDYFIWFDDTEHSLRLAGAGKIYCVPAACIDHDVPPETGLSWKVYYDVRNRLDICRCHFPAVTYLFGCLNYIVRALGARILRGDITKCRLYLTAVRDCVQHRFGMSEAYPPGKEM